MSLRDFTRKLKTNPPKNDMELYSYVKGYEPTIQRKTGVRMLSEYVVRQINNGANFRTLTELFGVLNILLPSIATSHLSKGFFHDMRIAVSKKYGDGSVEHKKTIEKMKLPKAVYDQIRKDYNERTIAKNHDKRQFDGNRIKTIVEQLYKSEYLPIDQLILLQLASGARIGELIYASDFKRSPKEQFIKQSGILKSKDKRDVIKPILYMTVDRFIDIFERVRTILNKEYTQKGRELSQHLNTAINTRIKNLFNRQDIRSHDLRRIYSDVSYKLFADHSTVSQQAYVAMVCGHDPNDIDIAKSYSTVNVNNVDVLRGLKLGPEIEAENADANADRENVNTEIPHNDKTKRDGRQRERMKDTMIAMKQNKMKVTARVLKEYGYSSRVIDQHMKSLKAELN